MFITSVIKIKRFAKVKWFQDKVRNVYSSLSCLSLINNNNKKFGWWWSNVLPLVIFHSNYDDFLRTSLSGFIRFSCFCLFVCFLWEFTLSFFVWFYCVWYSILCYRSLYFINLLPSSPLLTQYRQIDLVFCCMSNFFSLFLLFWWFIIITVDRIVLWYITGFIHVVDSFLNFSLLLYNLSYPIRPYSTPHSPNAPNSLLMVFQFIPSLSLLSMIWRISTSTLLFLSLYLCSFYVSNK
jgi:hypothetical protein